MTQKVLVSLISHSEPLLHGDTVAPWEPSACVCVSVPMCVCMCECLLCVSWLTTLGLMVKREEQSSRRKTNKVYTQKKHIYKHVHKRGIRWMSVAVSHVHVEGGLYIFLNEHGFISITACWMTVIRIPFTQFNVRLIVLGYDLNFPYTHHGVATT